MNIILYVNNSEKNKIGKSLTQIDSFSGTLRENCDVLNPSITFDVDISQVINANYMYIPDFNRYYFVTDIEILNNRLIRISGGVDVLETYKTQILLQTGVIYRQENQWNLYLDDGFFKTYQPTNTVLKEFPNGFDGTVNWILLTA